MPVTVHPAPANGTYLASAVFGRPVPGSWLLPLGTPNVAAFVGGLFTGAWIFVTDECPVDRIGIEVTTAATAGATCPLALYKRTGTSTLTKVFETSGLAIDSTGQKEAMISQTLTPGRYVAAIFPSANVSLRGRTAAAYVGFMPMDATELLSDPRSGVHSSSVGSPGSFLTTLTLTPGVRSYAPLVYLRAA